MFAAIEAWTEIENKKQLNIRYITYQDIDGKEPKGRWVALPFGLVNWITTSSLKMLTSSIAGMALTPILFKVLWSRLSSVVVVLWTAFFFLQLTTDIKKI